LIFRIILTTGISVFAGEYPEPEALHHPGERRAEGSGSYYAGADLPGLHIKLHGENGF
jgi:hypothetical protein